MMVSVHCSKHSFIDSLTGHFTGGVVRRKGRGFQSASGELVVHTAVTVRIVTHRSCLQAATRVG